MDDYDFTLVRHPASDAGSLASSPHATVTHLDALSDSKFTDLFELVSGPPSPAHESIHALISAFCSSPLSEHALASAAGATEAPTTSKVTAVADLPADGHAPACGLASRLSDALLTRIFLHLRDIYPAVPYATLGFILSSHVCQRWRNIMLACPALWRTTVFTFPHKRAVRTILERAQNTPTSAVFHPSFAPQQWHKEAFLASLPNIRSLRLSETDDFYLYHDWRALLHDWRALLNLLFTQSVPSLEHLHIRCRPDKERRTNHYLEEPVLIAPALRSLHLENIFFVCVSAALTSLVLRVSGPNVKPYASAYWVLDIIGSCSQTLEYLYIDDLDRAIRLTSQTRSEHFGEETVYLPKIKTILYRHSPLALLRALQFPPGTFVAVVSSGLPASELEIIREILLTRFASSTGQPLAVSLAATDRRTSFSILPIPPDASHAEARKLAERAIKTTDDVWECILSDDDSGSPAHPDGPGIMVEWDPVDMDETALPDTASFTTLLRTLADAAEAGSLAVERLDMCLAGDLSAAQWKELVKAFATVDALRMRTTSVRMLAALAAHPNKLLPQLSTLVLVLDDTCLLRSYPGRVHLNELLDATEALIVARLEAGRASIDRVRIEGQVESERFAEAMKERLVTYVPLVDFTSL